MLKLIAVNKNDQFLKLTYKKEAHLKNGILHRAFSIFIINNKKEILLQKRSRHKMLWPLFWSNACCSHPTISLSTSGSESLLKEAQKRLSEELGFTTKLRFIYKFIYQNNYKNIGSENELCYVLVGNYNGQVKLNKKELSHYKWVSLDWLNKDLIQNPNIYTPWFKLEIKELQKRQIL